MWKRQHPRNSLHNHQLLRLFQQSRAICGNLSTDCTERTGEIILQAVFWWPRQGCNHGVCVDGRGRCNSTPARLQESQPHIGVLTKTRRSSSWKSRRRHSSPHNCGKDACYCSLSPPCTRHSIFDTQTARHCSRYGQSMLPPGRLPRSPSSYCLESMLASQPRGLFHAK